MNQPGKMKRIFHISATLTVIAVAILAPLILLLSTPSDAQTIFGEEHIVNMESQYSRFLGTCVEVGDMDGDGDLDVVSASQNDTASFTEIPNDFVVWYANDGAGNFGAQQRITNLIDEGAKVVLGDIDRDDDLDVIVLSRSPDLTLYINDGLGNFGDQIVIINDNVGGVRSFDLNDLDGDGFKDIIHLRTPNTSSEVSGLIRWHKNLGDGSFGEAQLILEPFSIHVSSDIQSADLDGDADVDLVFVLNGLVWMANDGSGNFAAPAPIGGTSYSVNDFDLGDIDSDNDIDVVATRFFDKLRILENDGNGSFTSRDGTLPLHRSSYNIRLVDLDNDSDLDLSFASFFKSRMVAQFNDGSGIFDRECVVSNISGGASYITAGDMDGDDDIDLVSANRTNDDAVDHIFYHENRMSEDVTIVRGIIYWDMNSILDFNISDQDVAFSGLPVLVEPDNVYIQTGPYGNYYFETETEGTYDFTPTQPVGFICNTVAEMELADPESLPFSVPFAPGNKMYQEFAYQSITDNCRTISGRVFFDEDADAIFDPEEEGRNGIVVTANGTARTISSVGGYFSFNVGQDETVVVGLDLANSYTNVYCDAADLLLTQTYLPNNGNYFYEASENDIDTLLFGVHNEESNLFDVGIYTLMMQYGDVPGKKFYGWIDFTALGNIVEPCTLRIDHHPSVSLLNSDIPPTTEAGTYVEWVFPPGTTFDRYCMDMVWYLNCLLIEGDTIQWDASYTCTDGNDACPYNNTASVAVEVLLSNGRLSDAPVQLYSVRPEGNMPEIITREDDLFSFIVAFQNPIDEIVENMAISMQLPDELDFNSVSYPFSSIEDFDLTVSETGLLTVTMTDIELLVTDEEEDGLGSYGFFQFNIKMNENLPDGSSFTLGADVVFNQTEFCNSNEVLHRLEVVNGIFDQSSESLILIYPNPMTRSCAIVWPASESENFVIVITDLLGSGYKKV